jgi:hypothetical protein
VPASRSRLTVVLGRCPSSDMGCPIWLDPRYRWLFRGVGDEIGRCRRTALILAAIRQERSAHRDEDGFNWHRQRENRLGAGPSATVGMMIQR